ncbi:MAG TPA: hypothetical protein PKM63_12695 [Panacibacter sp.]|nr:hypothetical protein [Panacibacter sp.]HNP45139.1 hypothetical protein [Panacibacter sp.]
MRNKTIFLSSLALAIMMMIKPSAFCQDIKLLQQEAANLERQFKEPEALNRYSRIAEMNPKDLPALVKCTELNCSIGNRTPDKNAKKRYYLAAGDYAQKAYIVDSASADANYAMALVAGKMTEVEEEKKKIVEFVNLSKIYDDKALAINPNHAKANYLMGKWHYEIVNLSWVKRAAVNTLYGGLQKGSIDSAIAYLEKSRRLDQYFVRNYFDLAKAYDYNNQPAKAIDVLNKLLKLPTRTADDEGLKVQAKQLLEKLQ